MRHAALIIANKDLYILNKLVEQLDSPNINIYILLDKKSTIKDNEIIETKYSKVELVNRINIQWGSYSQIEAELALFKSSIAGNYDYYHLISGQDLLIKSHQYFDDFFSKNNGKQFITFCGKDWLDDSRKRIKYYYLTIGRSKNKLRLNKLFLMIQKLCFIKRNKKVNLYGGSNWLSLTNDAVKLMIEKEKYIKKVFKHSYCADELFVHTIIANSNLKDTIYYMNESQINDDTDLRMYSANQRFIDWNRGKPYVFRIDDFDYLVNSDAVFARKFDSSIDKDIIDKIVEENKYKLNDKILMPKNLTSSRIIRYEI